MHTQTIRIPKAEVSKIENFLGKGTLLEDRIYTAIFGNKIEADIKICNCNPPFIDAVLFQDGCEIQVCEPEFDRITGEYLFDGYTVVIEEE